jgi:hypothetical protein
MEDKKDIELVQDNFLPKDEEATDWFEITTAASNIPALSNKHAIDICHKLPKYVGVDTINNNRGKNYDLRNIPLCPKFVVSPWLAESFKAQEPEIFLQKN